MSLDRPYIIIFSTVSLDGRLASKTGYSNLSCKWDKIRQYILRSKVDAVVVGANTVRVDDPTLSPKKGGNYIRVIVTHSLNLNPSAKIFDTSLMRTLILTDNEEEEAWEKFRGRNIDLIRFNNICEGFSRLSADYNVRKIMVEGGGRLIWSIIREGCYDEVRITVSNKIFGSGRNLVEGEGFSDEEYPVLHLVKTQLCQCGNEVHMIFKKK